MASADQSDGSINHRALLVNARRVVIKVGTGVVCNTENEFDPQHVSALAKSIAALANTGRQIVLVSSGAVTLGAAELGIHRSRLKDASVTRACAAVGQCKLMQAYAESFRPHSLKVAQVLETEDDFSDLKRYSILRQTFERLLKLGAVPVVNENDTVTNIYTEQAPVFRDNDRLAPLVLCYLEPDALIFIANAAKALMPRQASLLFCGVPGCTGEFAAGKVIAVHGPDGHIMGKGIAEHGNQQLAAMLASGGPQKGVLVRRENFLILAAKEF